MGSAVTVNIILQASRDACPSVTNSVTITSQSIDVDRANDSATVTSALSESLCTLPPPKNLSYSLQVFNDLRSQGGSLNNNGDLLSAFGPPYLFKNGPYRPITLPLYKTFAFNDLDQVVGQTANPNKQVFQIYDNGKLQTLDLGELPTDVVAYPVAVNNLGTITGYRESFVVDTQHPFYQQSFVYQNGTTQSIFPSGVYARALNQKNEIAGEGNGSALLYSHGSVVASFEPPAVSTFVVSALDSSGRIGGFYAPARSNGYHGHVYSGGHFLDVGTSFGNSIIVEGINDCGDLVGKEDRTNKGFIYTRGRFTSLDDLITAPAGYFLQASHINNSGMILGYLYSPSKGGGGSFLLTPTVADKCGSDATLDNNPRLPTIIAGGLITYTIRAANLDTATTQFTVKDDLDPTTTVMSCTVSGGGGSCAATVDTHTVSVVLPNLSRGSTATIIVKAQSANTYSRNSVLINTAALSSSLSADYLATAYTSVR